MSVVPLLLVLLSFPQTPPETPSEVPPRDVLAEAQALIDKGEHDQALQLLEAASVAQPEQAAIQRALARGYESFVDAQGSWLAMTDARDAWDRALALEPDDIETQQGAIQVRLRLGEYELALVLAERALGAAWLSGGIAPPTLLELACRARIGALPPRGEESGDARDAALAKVWAALENARALAGGSIELVRMAAGLLEAEGLPERAAEELVEAIRVSRGATGGPATELHKSLIDLYVREGIEERLSTLYEGWSAAGTDATLAWFTGYAWRLGGDLALRERRHADALQAYDRAVQWMGVAATLEPSFQATAETIRFLSQVSSGWSQIESGALDAGGERLLPLLRANLERRNEPDGLGRSLLQALGVLGERRTQRNDFGQAVREARAVVALLDDDGGWWNNLGFLLREHATQVLAGHISEVPEEARESRSRELFQESWHAYRRATELLSEDPRVHNDGALIQVYHLRDNLAEAEAMLGRAVQLGEVGLAALGEDPDERERFPLAQALGDAYLNLGYLSYHVYRQSDRARGFFEQSLATDSGPRPDVEAYLVAIDGKDAPVEEPDRLAMVAAPLEELPSRAWPAWEASLAEARERASAEGRGLLLYHRGDGLGLWVPWLDEWVTSPSFVRDTKGAVLLVSGAERRTYVERRRDGRRVPCPRFGTVTCGEHVAVHAEVSAWLEEILGTAPGESEEGLWWLPVGADRPERVSDLAGLAELTASTEALEASVPNGAFEALEASLGGDDGGSEARSLVGTRSLTARLLTERVLWEGFHSSPARGHLLAALAEDTSPSSRELLTASTRQCADSDLKLAALRVWPAGLDLGAVIHASRWSSSAEVRAAAEKAWLRERPADPVWNARAVFGKR